ncbi:hypothetical protein [Arthrobacter sp. MMS18-M83]|uniref:hypothetical protein n=1 Tax=Arthrobacter sp. MMS18-M83 TaxID=2996261 RepID=UPI00227A0390|nr:hypothetical protein [Arthrobacter sp. MMS18-M83]WAH95288.1 hypothetical protein OW521_12535 [Arthrobacter sp. MMS18-M83]
MKRIVITKGTAPDESVPGTAPDESVPGTAPQPRPKDYVVVDDIGEFTYYPSETAMLEDLEYVDEAACILDRAGHDYRLTLDKDRNLCLGPSLGPVEFGWLRQAWTSNQHRTPQAHRLHRFFPATREALLTGLFETLSLERGTRESDTWVLDVDGEETRPATLKEVDGFLAGLDHLERATVHDPFGHDYRPVRHATHRFRALGAGAIYYVEIDPHAPNRQASSLDDGRS